MTTRVMQQDALNAEAIAKSFQLLTDSKVGQKLEVLNDMNLRLGEGEFVSLLGPSGCGKSTFIRIISRLEVPDRGSVAVLGNRSYAVGRDVTMVFQDAGLFPWMTVQRNVEFGLKMNGLDVKERATKANSYIDLVGMKGFEKSYPHQLSGGMRQRVGLARALACEPSLLLMDEPFAAVDTQTRERLQSELLAIWERRRSTVIFVTHSIEEAVFLSDRIVVMRTLGRGATREDPVAQGSIAEEINVDLERPRDRSSADYLNTMVRTRHALEKLIEHD